MASTERTAGKNRPTQVLVAGFYFIAVMCAIQVWRNNRATLLPCSESTPTVAARSSQIELPTVSTLSHRDDVVFMPYELNPSRRKQPDVPIVHEFSSALTQAEMDVPEAVPSTNSVRQTQPKVAQSLPSAVERFAAVAIQAPVDTMQLADVDLEPSLDEQMAELQKLDPSPRVAKQVIQANINDLAINTKATRAWPNELDLERDRLQEREQQLLDEMIEDFEQAIPDTEFEPNYRPTYRPEIDPSAEPIELEQPDLETEQPQSEQPKPTQPQPEQPQPNREPQPNQQKLAKPEKRAQPIATDAWPRPIAVLRALDKLAPVYGVKDWSDRVQTQLARLDEIGSISAPETLNVLVNLSELVRASAPISQQLPSREEQVALRQIAYALSRRVDVWQASHVAAQEHHQALPGEVFHSVDPSELLQRVADARQGLTRFRNSDSWVDYLLLDELEEAARGQGPFVGPARAELAEIALDRITDPNLSEQELEFLKSLGLEELGQELRLWSTHPVSQTDMLSALERFELDPTNPIKSGRLADYRKDLYWSAVPSQNNVAAALDKHYRNANVRMTVNQSMINRLVPAVRELRYPVRENILGARVKGQSRSRAQIFVRLLPDRSRLRFMFETRGEMAAQTAATKGPVTLWNRNRSHFQVRKVVVMDQFGSRFGRSQAVASGKSNLQAMRTKYDNYPLIGSIVRKAARRQHSQTAGLVRNIFVNRVEEQARQEVDHQIESELAAARRQFENKVFNPLRRMELNPRAVEMQTRSDGRVVVRGRLAADHQLAAFTARPQAYRGSMLSMQIHESAVNNFLQQLNLDGREAKLKDLYDEVTQKIDLGPTTEPADIPDDVMIKFAEKAAIRVVIEDGKVCLKLRIKSLKTDGDRGWSNFEVSANYFPYRDPDGMEFYFARGEGIGLSKKSSGGGIALRAIFTKVLSQNRKIHMVNPRLVEDSRLANLNVTQMEIHNGWIGLSVGRGATAPAVAIRESRNQTR